MKQVDSGQGSPQGLSLGKLLAVFCVALVGVIGIGVGVATLTEDRGRATEPKSAVKIQAAAELDVPSEPSSLDVSREQPVTYAEAESIFQAGSYEKAVGKFVAYAAAHPENVWAHYMLGLSNWKAGHPVEAEAAFLQALDLSPDHVKSLINLARVRLDTGDYNEALGPAAKAVQLQPQSVDAQRVLGRVFHNLGRRSEAIEAYVRVLSLRDNDLWALNNLGLLLIESERFSEAIPPLARAVQQNPRVAFFQNNLGVALERAGYFREAVVAYGNALAADSTCDKAEISRRRAQELVLTQSLPPLDLAAVAREFRVPGTMAQAGRTTAETDSAKVSDSTVSASVQHVVVSRPR